MTRQGLKPYICYFVVLLRTRSKHITFLAGAAHFAPLPSRLCRCVEAVFVSCSFSLLVDDAISTQFRAEPCGLLAQRPLGYSHAIRRPR